MVSPEILAGAYPPTASRPRCPEPQKVRRAPPTTPTSRLSALSRSESELRVGVWAPTHGVRFTPCATALAGTAADNAAAARIAGTFVSFRIDIHTPLVDGAAAPLIARGPGLSPADPLWLDRLSWRCEGRVVERVG